MDDKRLLAGHDDCEEEVVTYTQHAVWRDSRASERQNTTGFYKSLIAMTGHDLRHPLQIIVSVNSLLSRQLSGVQESEHVAKSQRATFELMRQLDRLIDAIRVHERTETVELKSVRVNELLDRLYHDYIATADNSGLQFRVVRSSEIVMSDSMLLEGILRNLVNNSIKYTRRGGKILLGCRRLESGLRIEVHDTGAGIAAASMSRIFNPFERLETDVPEGLGLGLFIVRHAAACLGHRIDVRSTEGKGSCFSVDIDSP